MGEIEGHCRASGLGSLLDVFQEGAKAGVTKLLAAFFASDQTASAPAVIRPLFSLIRVLVNISRPVELSGH